MGTHRGSSEPKGQVGSGWNWDARPNDLTTIRAARSAARMFEAPEVESSRIDARVLKDGGLATGADRPTKYRATVLENGERVERTITPPSGQVVGNFDAYGGASTTERGTENARRLADRIRASGLVSPFATDGQAIEAHLASVNGPARQSSQRAPMDRRAFALAKRVKKMRARGVDEKVIRSLVTRAVRKAA